MINKLAQPPKDINAFELTNAQDKAMDTMISDATYNALGGGSRCVSGDTIIDGQTLTIKELAEIGKPIVVITSHGRQWVDAPFKKGSDVLLEVITESGKRIEVTSDHRFWNGERWTYAKDVTVGSSLAALLCEQNLQASSSEHETYLMSCNDTPVRNGYKLEKVLTVTKTTKKDYYTLHVPSTEQYFANGLLHHNSGKTFLLVRAVVIRALKAKGSRHAIFRFRFNAIKASIVFDTLPKVMSLCFPGLMAKSNLNKTDWFLTLPNGSEIWFAGLDDKERAEKVLGQEFATIYFNECSQIPWQSIVLALTRLAQKTDCLRLKCYVDFNPPSKKHWTYLLFIEKRDPETKRAKANPFDYSFFLINPGDNRENLDPKYLSMLDALPEKARNRFLLGRFADDSDGALWTEQCLAVNRRLGQEGTLPDWLRVIIAVDPSGCSGDEDTRSDEVGIIVAALGTDSHAYILEDLSGRYSPEQWADVVNGAFERHGADKVYGEKNFGGDMVRAVLQAKNPNLPYEHVVATRGKIVRAEPIAALDDLGKVHHVGYFPEMEDQLLAMTTGGYMGVRSPDRADARIWAISALFPALTKKDSNSNWTPPGKITNKRSASRYNGGSTTVNRSASKFDKPSRKW